MINTSFSRIDDKKIYFSSRILIFALLHSALVFVGGLAIPLYYYFNSFSEFPIITRYLLSFWKQQWHLYGPILLAYAFLTVSLSTAIGDTYIRHTAYQSPRRRTLARRAKRAASVWTFVAIFMSSMALPFVAQRAPWILIYAFFALFSAAVLVLHVNASREMIPRLGKYRFHTLPFNVAALAPLSLEVEQKLEEFREARVQGGISQHSGSILNTANSEVFRGLTSLLRIDSPDRIRLAFNTTSAVRIATEEVKRHCLKTGRLPLLITTDAEYPAILELIVCHATELTKDDNLPDLYDQAFQAYIQAQSNGMLDRLKNEYFDRIEDFCDRQVLGVRDSLYEAARALNPMPDTLAYVLPVRSSVTLGTATSSEVCRRLLEVAKAAANAGRPALIVASHVHWETGFVLDIEEFSRQLVHIPELELNKNLYIVVDGAQAVGHIVVGPCEEDRTTALTFWDCVSYYAACTHKWLLGKETLGFLVQCAPIERIPSDGSMFSYNEKFYSGYGGTINVESFVGASVSLREIVDIGMKSIVRHNLELARLFRTGLYSIEGLEPREERDSAIVLVRCRDELADHIQSRYEKRRGSVVSKIRLPIRDDSSYSACSSQPFQEQEDAGNYAFLRFCFHYFHSEKDVLDLIDELETMVYHARRTSY